MADKKLTTWEVLRYKFPANEYVLIEEVSDASGFSRSRSLDYMLINLWNSRGLAVTGIEKKSNRGDWLKELKTPAKQENHFKHCDFFYLLTDKEGVAKLEEIPLTWGWYHINENGILKTMKAAPKLESLPIGRSLLCAMLRRAACKESYVHIDSIETRIQEAVEAQKIRLGNKMKSDLENYEDLKQQVAAFEEASGVKIAERYSGINDSKKIGEIVKAIKNNGIKDYEDRLLRLENQAKSIYESIQNSLSKLKE